MKVCANKNCSQQNPQPLDCFHNNRNEPDGLSRYCKTCMRATATAYWRNASYWTQRGKQIARERKQAAQTHTEKL